MTLTFELDLDILPLDLHIEIQVFMSVCLAVRVVTDTHTDTQTMSKLLHPTRHIRDVGCKNHPTVALENRKCYMFPLSTLIEISGELCPENLYTVSSADQMLTNLL